jgi:hypothetical protein
LAIWYILWSLGIYFPVLVFCTKKNLATLVNASPSQTVWPVRAMFFKLQEWHNFFGQCYSR